MKYTTFCGIVTEKRRPVACTLRHKTDDTIFCSVDSAKFGSNMPIFHEKQTPARFQCVCFGDGLCPKS